MTHWLPDDQVMADAAAWFAPEAMRDWLDRLISRAAPGHNLYLICDEVELPLIARRWTQSPHYGEYRILANVADVWLIWRPNHRRSGVVALSPIVAAWSLDVWRRYRGRVPIASAWALLDERLDPAAGQGETDMMRGLAL